MTGSNALQQSMCKIAKEFNSVLIPHNSPCTEIVASICLSNLSVY